MKSIAPGITVNGIKITPEEINTEVQYHPAENRVDAKYKAMQALVIRELLLQRAVELGLCERDDIMTNVDEILGDLFDREIDVPEADKETCERFYNGNKDRFVTSPLFEAAHILYPAPPFDEDEREVAKEKAQSALDRIRKNPDLFEKIARTESICSSAKLDGHLGQISKGQTTPAFEAALMNMKEGELSAAPLSSEYGYHVIKVHKRIEGKKLTFGIAYDWIVDYLQRKSWESAFSQYVQLLAGQSEISGFRLKQADSPLVQ